MNAKEADVICERYKAQQEAPVPPAIDEVIPFMDYRLAFGFLEATKAAEPLLGVIEDLREALKRIAPYEVDVTKENRGMTDCPYDLSLSNHALAQKALSSSAKVVEEYRRKHLGEE